MRRRLRFGVGEPTELYGWKPFGGADYGYPERSDLVISWTKWALVTWGSASVDIYEAVGLLAGAVALNEYEARKDKYKGPDGENASGASFVHNIQGGYCSYHYFWKGQKQWPLWLGTWASVGGNMAAIAKEIKEGERMYSHKAHAVGHSIGFVVALLLDRLRPHPGSKTSTFWKTIPILAIATMMWADTRENED